MLNRGVLLIALLLSTACSVQLAQKPGSSEQIAAHRLAALGDDRAALEQIEAGLREAVDPEVRGRLLHERAGILIRIEPAARDDIISGLQASRALGHAPATIALANYLARDGASAADLETAANLYLEVYETDPSAAVALAGLLRSGAVSLPTLNPDRLIAGAVEVLQQRARAGDAGASRSLGRLYRDGVLSAGNEAQAESHFGAAIVAGDETAVVELARMLLVSGDRSRTERARQMLEDAAGKGSLASMGVLARAYQNGSFGSPDLARARSWYEQALAAGATAHAVSLASLVLEEQAPAADDVRRAIALLDGRIGQGDPRAAMVRAAMHANGIGGPVDDRAAFGLYQSAADAGSVDGLEALADAYAGGRGVPANPSRAVALWQQAVDQGSQGALLDLGRAYAEGLGVARDPARAETLLLKAADAGSAGAALPLARLYEAGINGTPDLPRAIPYYEQAAATGSVSAMRWLADLFDDPESGYTDPAQAAVWLHQAADRQAAWAMFRLAQAYGQGRGVARDAAASALWVGRYADAEPGNDARIARAYEEGLLGWNNAHHAIAWYQRAAQTGDARAMRALAAAYANGHGVGRDAAAAQDWLRRAAAAGDMPAIGTLAQQLLATGEPDHVTEALALWQRGAERGDVRSMRELANALAGGLNGRLDASEAAQWYQRAASAGDGESQYRLGMMYLQGLGVAADSDRARELLESAARNDIRMAATALEALGN